MESTRVDGAGTPIDGVTGADGTTVTLDLTGAGGTTGADDTAGTGTAGTGAEVARLGQELGRHARLLHLIKTHLPDVMPSGVDWAAFGVLAQLTKCGATRQTDLAELSLLDPSTVSRHVGQLVRQGLVERRPDPQDGRAVRLVASERGRAIVEEIVRQRNQAFLIALQGWQAEDLHTLTTLLTRFNDDLETFRQNAGRAGPASPPPPAHRADEAPA
jgi:DNA-binding MarR family transcriptional regulator